MAANGIASARACSALFWTFELVLIGCLAWRALCPANRAQGGLDFAAIKANGAEYYVPYDTHRYDDAVTQVTARNFVRDGLGRTHGLPNRRGAPRVSLYDFSGTQCESLAPPERPLEEWNAFGQRVENVSATGDCVHLHYPPLADWIFAGLARAGFDQVRDYKLFALLLNAGLLALVRRWLEREVAPPAALAATVLAGTLPAFLSWADALYFHPFQLLFLLVGTLAWGEALARRKRSAFVLTFVAFFCEALVSPQAVLFFALMLLGSSALAPAGRSWRSRVLELAIQALAPVSALALHASLGVSLFGWRRVTANWARTLADRVTQGPAGGLRALSDSVERTLAPWAVMALGLLVVVAVRRSAGQPLRRPLGLLATFLLGGSSFALAFPGAAGWHATSLQRLLLPFVVLLLAFVADAARAAFGLRAVREHRLAGAGLFGLAAVALGWVAYQNAHRVRQELAFARLVARRVDTTNLVRRALDVIYWSAGVPRYQGFVLSPLSGLRVYEPPGWLNGFRMLGPEAFHYELWWLEPEKLEAVRLLVDRADAAPVTEHCTLAVLGGTGFETNAGGRAMGTQPFTPAPDEPAPREPYAWVELSFPEPPRTRALRVSCTGLPSVTLRQLEVR